MGPKLLLQYNSRNADRIQQLEAGVGSTVVLPHGWFCLEYSGKHLLCNGLCPTLRELRRLISSSRVYGSLHELLLFCVLRVLRGNEPHAVHVGRSVVVSRTWHHGQVAGEEHQGVFVGICWPQMQQVCMHEWQPRRPGM